MSREVEERLSWCEQLRLLRDALLYSVCLWLHEKFAYQVAVPKERPTMDVSQFWFEQVKMPNYKLLRRFPRRRGACPEDVVELTIAASCFDTEPVRRVIAFPDSVRIVRIQSSSSGYRVQLFNHNGRPLLRRPHLAMAVDLNPKGVYVEAIEVTRDPTLVGRAPFVIEFVVEPIPDEDEAKAAQ